MCLTEYSDHHAVLEYLQRPVLDEVAASDGVGLVHHILARRAEHRFDLYRNRLEAALRRLSEDRQSQYLAMKCIAMPPCISIRKPSIPERTLHKTPVGDSGEINADRGIGTNVWDGRQ